MLAECTSEQAAEIISVIRRINRTLELRIPRSDILPKLQSIYACVLINSYVTRKSVRILPIMA